MLLTVSCSVAHNISGTNPLLWARRGPVGAVFGVVCLVGSVVDLVETAQAVVCPDVA